MWCRRDHQSSTLRRVLGADTKIRLQINGLAILRSQNMDLIRLLFWLPSCSDMRMVDAGAVESGPFGRGVALEQDGHRVSNFEESRSRPGFCLRRRTA